MSDWKETGNQDEALQKQVQREREKPEQEMKEGAAALDESSVEAQEAEGVQVASDSARGGPNTPEGRSAMRGPEIPPEFLAELARIKSLPPDQRRKAVADFFDAQQDFLGNQSKEARQLQELNSGVLPGGKGVFFVLPDGERITIPYEEESH